MKEQSISKTVISTRPKRERAVLVGVALKGRSQLWSLDDSLAELAQLTRTAGASVVDVVRQQLDRPTHRYLGGGKLEELKSLREDLGYNLVIADDELTPTQQRNLEKVLGEDVKVLDRTALILDIFSQRAQTKEGRLQVDLAQHEYLLPRLAGQWSHLERLGGGIGTRGPGETQIETDRRLIRRRIQKVKSQLEEVRRHRIRYRSSRKARDIPVVSLVGYTNAGKSTLLNALTGAGVVSEDKLFSTLDPVTRRVKLPSGVSVLLTDTVGFIHKLPHSVVAAFRATLEELQDANVILHVVDASHQNAVKQARVVDQVLTELEVHRKPRILVFNKLDKSPGRSKDLLLERSTDNTLGLNGDVKGVGVSAIESIGLGRLLQAIEEVLVESSVEEQREQIKLAHNTA